MTGMSAGLSGLKKRNAHSQEKGQARHAGREASLFAVAICSAGAVTLRRAG